MSPKPSKLSNTSRLQLPLMSLKPSKSSRLLLRPILLLNLLSFLNLTNSSNTRTLAMIQASYLFAPAMTHQPTSSHTKEKGMEASMAPYSLEAPGSSVRDDERVACS